ncbi:MAG: ATP:cob(I)alamin adenosyltransferase [Candidatus Izemoplasmatales bacterium]
MPITKTSQISSKKGDQGSSYNFVNESFSKDHILFEVLGTTDELSSYLGLTYHFQKDEFIQVIQKTLQDINSLIATNPEHILYSKLRKIQEDEIVLLETRMEEMLVQHPLEPKFALPGSDTSLPGAYMDISRAVARKAERLLVHFIKTEHREDLAMCLKYMNRLSDFLFVYARFLSQ